MQQDDCYSFWFIASSGPKQGKEEEFLEVILQNNYKIVICLENLVSYARLCIAQLLREKQNKRNVFFIPKFKMLNCFLFFYDKKFYFNAYMKYLKKMFYCFFLIFT